ncbi:hypothetical protein G7B40_029515 [Aetokthonos hydrillicola Thurmond2011]|jgi:hypothetical protein|uniref:Uncharacterized protein n=1 Tax=Aetokthonos hydrillicola Thurmond2011 TaxID=2712845 RepID=A0AAP5MC23_9CYAN|nr:hypothetical protein [Aetokthonos hydrillicola]MBO3462513.1 hypothetical protein [Aetokthonos hydrillicola CCALA 1050]MBW4587468.1 hypothetical protein [Aetokthonos hydrillicola CCALA 1050]MDR9898667.1 hypothetical protein [Aetokthonos hydrillicola Thurmond2011]
MSYSQFTLSSVKRKFGLQTVESSGIFANIPEVDISSWLQQTFSYGLEVALASDSEKARSELIIAPMMLELRNTSQVNVFSGVDFTVDEENGLNGICDFLITASPEKLIIEAPVVAVVEAKKENIISGLGQCVAEMYAAQIFNETKNLIHGVVTTGSAWKFLSLADKTVEVDTAEYYIDNPNKILGILTSFVSKTNRG